jgi:plastocyanin
MNKVVADHSAAPEGPDSHHTQEMEMNIGNPGSAHLRPGFTGWLLLIGAITYCGVATAATHDVLVGNNFFSPNDLTIEVGDTVRWTNSSGFHDVTADDGSWASETSSSFVYSRTFNSVEEILYYCTVHSSPGRDINTSMNGRINVIEAGDDFLINDAISDAWFNPQTDGQGLLITVWEPSSFMFVAWFTFDTERPAEDVVAMLGAPGQRWLTAQGGYVGDKATLDLFVSSDGVFDMGEPAVNTVQDGTMEIEFSGCNAGVVKYEIDSLDISAEIPIQRIVLDKVPACQAAQAPAQ